MSHLWTMQDPAIRPEEDRGRPRKHKGFVPLELLLLYGVIFGGRGSLLFTQIWRCSRSRQVLDRYLCPVPSA